MIQHAHKFVNYDEPEMRGRDVHHPGFYKVGILTADSVVEQGLTSH